MSLHNERAVVQPRASVVVPAHNEEAVIGRCLSSLLAEAEPGEFVVYVVANGCSDRTADIAREYGPDVRVIETPVGSKINALNLGDEAAAGTFPRLYIDADLVLTTEAARRVLDTVESGGVLAAAPLFEFDLQGCTALVRAYYAVWRCMPYFDTGRIAGAFVLSAAGRQRFGRFPDVLSDDGFVRLHFAPPERVTVVEATVVVSAPRSLVSLVRIKTRSKAGTIELRRKYPELFVHETASPQATLRRILVRPLLWPCAAVYLAVNVVARARARGMLRRGERVWERDDTTRVSLGSKEYAR